MRSALDRTLFVPVRAIRPYLAVKLTLLLLSLDMWLTRIPHAGRYGVGPFNVSHFAALDAIQPMLTPGLYIGVCVVTGTLCMLLALASRPPRWLIGLTFLLHTWSWAMSMFDSYQHHYLLSIVLFAMMFFPRLSAEDVLGRATPKAAKRDEPEESAAGPAARGRRKKRRRAKRGASKTRAASSEASKRARGGASLLAPSPLASAWAFSLLAVSIAVVYTYTAYSKSDPEWLSGATLIRVLHLDKAGMPVGDAFDPVAPIRWLAGWVGIEGRTFWWMMGHSVVVLQVVCAAGYVLAPFRDVTRHFALRALSFLALFMALGFHLGAEYMSLQIGWFSWYMIGYALIFLLPGRWLVAITRLLLPTSERHGTEILMARGGIATGVMLLGLTGSFWSGNEHLARIFGEGTNMPLVLLGTALFLLTPVRLMTHAADRVSDQKKKIALGAAATGAVALAAAGLLVDLPGASLATGFCALGIGAAVVYLLVQHQDARPIHAYGVGATLAAVALFLSIGLTDTRWDFYRNVGGDHYRRGELRTSLEAYLKANEYAPEGENRDRKIQMVRERLEREGIEPAGQRR